MSYFPHNHAAMVLSAYIDIERDTSRLGALNTSVLQPFKTQEVSISQLNLSIFNVATLLSPAWILAAHSSSSHRSHKDSTSVCSCSPSQLVRTPCHFQRTTASSATARAAVMYARPRPLLRSRPYRIQTKVEQHLMNRVYCICLHRPLVQAPGLCLCCSFLPPCYVLLILLFLVCIDENLSR